MASLKMSITYTSRFQRRCINQREGGQCPASELLATFTTRHALLAEADLVSYLVHATILDATQNLRHVAAFLITHMYFLVFLITHM